MRSITNIAYTKGLALDAFLPEEDDFTTILMIHGGGIVEGDKADEHWKELCFQFVEKGYGVITPNYSLYPNTKYPQYLKECALAIRYALDYLKYFGGNGSLYVYGQSAGAYIAMMLCCNKAIYEEVGVDPSLIKGYLSDSGQVTDHFHYLEYELGLDPWLNRISEHSPLYYLGPSFSCPPILLIAYEEDLPCRVEQNQLFLSSLKHYQKEADAKLLILPGPHVNASVAKDEAGEFPIVDIADKWIKEHA